VTRFGLAFYVTLCLQRIITDCVTWSEYCPCHEHLGVGVQTRSQWQADYHRELTEPLSSTTTCPCKGTRAPDMATGAWRVVIERIVELHVVDLLRQLEHVRDADLVEVLASWG
jgi:hypothetical protein